MHRFDPTWPQHWPDLGPTSASKGPTWTHLPPTPNLGPRWRNLSPLLRSIRLQNGRHSRNPQNANFTGIFHVAALRLKQCSSSWCEAVANGPQDAPLWTRLRLPCASPCLVSIWIALGPAAQLQPNINNWRQLGPVRLAQLGPHWQPGAQPETICGLNATR